MARDLFVYWDKVIPLKEDIENLLNEYTRGLGEVRWLEPKKRWFVDLPGRPSYPLQRIEQVQRKRWFEVYVGHELTNDGPCIDVITREMDEITNNIARGFAVIAARVWEGRLGE